MSDQDRHRWDARYAQGAYRERTHPSVFLQAHLRDIPRGSAVDIGCGRGRNARYLAQQGFEVDAIDVSPIGLQLAAQCVADAQMSVNWHCQDLLEQPKLPAQGYQLIIMFRFVAAELLASLPGYLAAGGYLMVEQHMRATPAMVDLEIGGPGGDRFRVEPDELLTTLRGEAGGDVLDILVHEQGVFADPDGADMVLSRILVRKPG